MKEENIKKIGKIVIGLTAVASTIASGVSYYYTSQSCLNHFVYHNDNKTQTYSKNVDIAACYYLPFIMTPVVAVMLTSYISFKIFYGLSSDITKPFDNTNHGLAKCLKDNDDPSNDPNDDNSMPHPQSDFFSIEIVPINTYQRFMLQFDQNALDEMRTINYSFDEPQPAALPAQPAGTMELDAQTHNDQESSMIDEEMVQPQAALPAQPAGTMEPDTQTHTDQEIFDLFRNNIDHVDEEQPSSNENDTKIQPNYTPTMLTFLHSIVYEDQIASQPAQPAGIMEPDAQTHNDQESSMIDEEMVQLEIDEPQPAALPAQPAGTMEPAALPAQPADYYDLA